MDLLASSPDLMLVEPIAENFLEYLLLNKEAHKLKFVPPPTIEHKSIAYVFNEINGQMTRQTRIMEDPTIEKPSCYPETLFLAVQSQKTQRQQTVVPHRSSLHRHHQC